MPPPRLRESNPRGRPTTLLQPHTQHSWTGRSHAHGTEHARWAKQVKTRDRSCQLQYPGCTGGADHIINVRAGGARYDPANGQAACTHCHKIKTQTEAQAARRTSKTRTDPR
ncbi:HNH endonuclease [Leucobacter sp. gxy201]|uniref:HNH endonuclease n=1 Tax=Leucobacter sp. gxy201 TaxID=2957200 RepID=UPI003DA11BBA